MLGQTSAQALALDFRDLQDATVAKDWFNAPQKTRSIGGGYLAADPKAAFAQPVLAETFDGLVWHLEKLRLLGSLSSDHTTLC